MADIKTELKKISEKIDSITQEWNELVGSEATQESSIKEVAVQIIHLRNEAAGRVNERERCVESGDGSGATCARVGAEEGIQLFESARREMDERKLLLGETVKEKAEILSNFIGLYNKRDALQKRKGELEVAIKKFDESIDPLNKLFNSSGKKGQFTR